MLLFTVHGFYEEWEKTISFSIILFRFDDGNFKHIKIWKCGEMDHDFMMSLTSGKCDNAASYMICSICCLFVEA